MAEKTYNPVEIHDCGEIDLSSHMVIEASAGTGKTYTIEQIVARLLESGGIDSLDQVLVVTYTEKATGEIKERIRQLLHERRKNSAGPAAARIQESLDAFDSASIFTIHGFCNRVLQLYSFENNGSFTFSLADDASVYDIVLKNIIRGWHKKFGPGVEDILKVSGFPDVKRDRSGWMSLVLSMAEKFTPEAGDVLFPSVSGDLIADMKRLVAPCAQVLAELDPLIGPAGEEHPPVSRFAEQYRELKIPDKSKNKRLRELVHPLVELVNTFRRGELLPSSLVVFKRNIKLDEDGFGKLMKSGTRAKLDFETGLPFLPRVVQLADELCSLIPLSIESSLAVSTINSVLEHAAVYKRERGLISYKDMISLVEKGTRDLQGPLCAELRKKYRYAIVDEFQDTDMLQWSLFRNVFLEGKGNRLIVVGDPKQAIYGFRGADVYAYHAAKKEMLGRGADYYSLADNWRSSRQLVSSFNRLFRPGNWFTDQAVEYRDVKYPESRDTSASGADSRLIVVDMGESTATEARYRYCRFMAREIRALLSAGFEHKQIAVLIRSWTEAYAVETGLRREGVRFSYYKRDGLFQSRGALEIRCVLEAVADPADHRAVRRALLTRFFGVAVESLAGYDLLRENHPVTLALFRWHTLAAEKRWGALFHSLVHDSGLSLRVMQDEDGERALTDCYHIIEFLSAQANSSKKDIRWIIKKLDSLIAGNRAGDDAVNYHRPEQEDPGVQIMTIHASKGLQFPVVFIAGGFGRPKPAAVPQYHDRGRRCFDLAGEAGSRERHNREQRWEDERLFYVALTRAGELLYVPYFVPTSKAASSAGPEGGWIATALDTCSAPEVTRVKGLNISENIRESASGTNAPVQGIDPSCVQALLEEKNESFLTRKVMVESFSSIKSREEEGLLRGEELSFGERVNKESDEPRGADDDVPPKVSDDALPGGATIGNIFHEIFERIDFSAVMNAAGPAHLKKNSEVARIVKGALDAHLPLRYRDESEAIGDDIIRVVWNTLRTDISGSGLVLGRIESRVHEMGFYLPVTHITRSEMGSEHGYLKGFIDMAFEHESKYFILDWKSNIINAGYGKDSLARTMEESRYDLQYRIYAASFVRMLKQSVAGFDYERHFGGIYYLFIRGIDPGMPGNGVFFYRPADETEIFRYEKILGGKF